MSSSQTHQQIDDNMRQIDNKLDALVDITGNLNVAAQSIGNELEDQNRMLADTNQRMDKTNENIQKATDAVVEVKATASNWVAWILIVLLIIAIILIWVFWK